MFADNGNNYTSSIHKYNELKSLADSCYFLRNYEGALYYYEKALQYTNCIKGVDLYNAACVAALNGNTEQAFIWLRRRMALEPEWYIRDMNRDKDLESLRHTPQWQNLVTDMISRRNATERLYDQNLRNQLLKIGEDDQRIRSQWFVASRQIPFNNQLVDSISTVMYRVDSVNQIKICKILDTRGFVGKSVVGDACSVYWLVIQHSPLELQEKYLPLFKKAAQNGDIPLSNVAMMEDRVNMFQGKPQKYGSQIVDGHLWKLQDEGMVDQWRKQVGMEPLNDYLKRMNAKR